MTMTDDTEVRSMAATLGMGNALFKDVPVGGAFRFKHSGTLTKVGDRRYQDSEGRTFETGSRTAVFIEAKQ